MQMIITAPEKLKATVVLPSSKSISNRVLVMNAMSGSEEKPRNVSVCDDTRVMVRAFEEDEEVVDIMAAGTAMRFLTAYYAATPGKVKTMTGTKRMCQRPIRVLVDALRALGADIEYVAEEGFPPLYIKGKELEVERVELPGSVSSQYISALLMVGPMLKKGLRLKLTGAVISRPYINLTLSLMRDFGADAAWDGEREIVVAPKPYRTIPFTVESDWSAASYWYEMVALSEDESARIVLPELWQESYQGDAEVAQIFARLGIVTTYDREHRSVVLHKGGEVVERMEYDFVNQPDLAQTVVVTCCMLDIPFRFTGLQSLKIKETDRMAALICELGKLGYVLEEKDDSILSWDGTHLLIDPVPGSEVAIDTYEDHRMAMAFAPVCLKQEQVKINNPEVVSKSYPGFWDDLKQVGFELAERP